MASWHGISSSSLRYSYRPAVQRHGRAGTCDNKRCSTLPVGSVQEDVNRRRLVRSVHGTIRAVTQYPISRLLPFSKTAPAQLRPASHTRLEAAVLPSTGVCYPLFLAYAQSGVLHHPSGFVRARGRSCMHTLSPAALQHTNWPSA